jgi:hypothetical protein
VFTPEDRRNVPLAQAGGISHAAMPAPASMPNANTAAAMITRIGRLAMACADGTDRLNREICRPQPPQETAGADAKSGCRIADKGNLDMHRSCQF